MLRISKLADYATVIMRVFAREDGKLYSASALAERTKLQLPTVSKILKLLQKEGLLLAVRGVDGGYRLAREPEKISLAQVIAAVEGSPGLTECSLEHASCEHQSCCEAKSNWQLINRVVIAALENVSIADMAKPLKHHPLVNRGIALRPGIKVPGIKVVLEKSDDR